MYKIYYLSTDYDNNLPKYIGYTSSELEKRLKEHVRNSKCVKNGTIKDNWIKNRLNNNYKINIFLLKNDILTLEEALTSEREFILKLKQKHNLKNSTNGGEKNKIFTDEIKLKISESLKKYYINNEPKNKGKKFPGLHKNRINPDWSGDKNPFYGRLHTEEVKKYLSDINRKHKEYTYDELYDLYITKNMNQNEIADMLKLTRPYVCRLMKKYKLQKIKIEINGQKSTTKNIKNRKYKRFSYNKLYQLYVIDNMTQIDISKKYNVSKNHIYKECKRHNIKK